MVIYWLRLSGEFMSLSEFIEKHALDKVEAMNLLQQNATISDLCVNAEDVGWYDWDRAIDFLKNHYGIS
jgi:hypothetical protein